MNNRSKIVRETVRRFIHLPNLTIARYLINEYGDLFDNNLDTARTAVRTVRGRKGDKMRDEVVDKSLYLTDKDKVKIPQTWAKTREPYKLNAGSWLVLSDVHIPYHRELPIETAVSYGQSQKVTGILINGDLFDDAAVGFWPTAKKDFNKELEACIDFLDFLRQEFPTQEIVFKPGNHEYRLPRIFVNKMPELCETPLAAMETVIGFEERKIEFLDYYQIVKAGELPIIHGHEVRFLDRSVSPARGLYRKTKTYSACSHCHQTSEWTTRDINGLLITTWSFGALCDLNPDYNPYGNDWCWGVGLINVDKNGDFEVENKRILPNGKLR